jgi:hypothetical protein
LTVMAPALVANTAASVAAALVMALHQIVARWPPSTRKLAAALIPKAP